MTGGWQRRVRAVIGNRFSLWVAFVLVHLWLGYENLYSPTNPFGDVKSVYRYWMDQAFVSHYWVGVDAPWVYPIVALLPMMVAYVFGSAFYASSWLSFIMVLDAVALATLTGWGRTRRSLAAGWWWVLFLLALGPVSLGRIDAVSVAIAIVGVLLLAKHPTAASVLITLATWIKVWPAALLATIVIASRHRVAVIGSLVGTSIGIIAIALAFGSGTNVLSFITQQTGRGLQIEAPVSTIWLWRGFAGVPETFVYYDTTILTFQVSGPGTQLASAIMSPLLVVAFAAVAALGIRAMRRRVTVAELLPLLSLGFVLCFIVFNKVGSPQYESWLAVPIVLALASGGTSRARFRVPAIAALIIAATTQLIYPYFYDQLVTLHPLMLVVLTVRNLLMIGLFVWVVADLWVVPEKVVNSEEWDGSAWPLGSRDPSRVPGGSSRADSTARTSPRD
ncbi:glycosyltransferase family 87 protein [soil metagenome]